jgi:hypothetical protein
MYFSCAVAANKARTAVLVRLNVIFSNRVRLDFEDLCAESGERVHTSFVMRQALISAGVSDILGEATLKRGVRLVIPPPKPRIRNNPEVAAISSLPLLLTSSQATPSHG